MIVVMSETIRIHEADMALLRSVAKKRGISIVKALALAVDALRRDLEATAEVARMNEHAAKFNEEAEDVQGYAAPW